jgi:hypothetical protein
LMIVAIEAPLSRLSISRRTRSVIAFPSLGS